MTFSWAIAMSDMRVIARTAKTKEQVRSMRHCMRGITADLKVGATLPADLKVGVTLPADLKGRRHTRGHLRVGRFPGLKVGAPDMIRDRLSIFPGADRLISTH